MSLTRRAFLLSPLLFRDDLYRHGPAAYPIHPGDLLIKRDGLLYPFSGQHPFAGVATTNAGAGECVEFVEARQ